MNDDEQDGNVAYTVELGPTSSADPDYDDLDPADVSVTNQDNESQGNTFESQDVPKNIADPHPRKGPKPTASELVIDSTGITVDLIDVDVSIDHASMSDLTIVTLTSPSNTTADVAYDGANWDLVNGGAFNNEPLDGTWLLTVADTEKNFIPGTLNAWSITVTPMTEAAGASSQSGTAVDMALLAWLASDSTEDDDTDPLAGQAADELALKLLE